MHPHHIQANVFFDHLFAFQSKPEDMKVVKDCINITRSFCDLTDVWVNRTDMYISQVVGYRENAVVVSCMGSFFLASDSEFVLLSSSSSLSSSLLLCQKARSSVKVF